MKTPDEGPWLILRKLRSGEKHMNVPRTGFKVSTSVHTWDSINGFGAAKFRVTIHYDSVDVPLVTGDELIGWLQKTLSTDSSCPVLTITLAR